MNQKPIKLPKITLYRRQRQIVEFMSQFAQKHGYSPTLREVAEATGLKSIATVHEHLRKLMEKGVISQADNQGRRKLEVVDAVFNQNRLGVDLPILGWISAGQPIMPYEDFDASLQVSPQMLTGKRRAFVLQVRGDSMIDEGIVDGDYVVVEEEQKVKDGDIVVAILENGLATLKKFFREATRIRLEPANAAMAPIYATRVQIQGRVVGIVRKFLRAN